MSDDFANKIAEFFAEFRNRRIYARLDLDTLRSIADAEVEQAIVDYVVTKIRGNSEREIEIVRALRVGVRATYLTRIVEGEVCNGGFNQYYFNPSGKFASDAVGAFEYFGARELAVLMAAANAVRASEAGDMAEFEKRGTWEAFAESYDRTRLGDLDGRFYGLCKNLSSMRIARIREIPEDFLGE
jgi:hypothetical protein